MRQLDHNIEEIEDDSSPEKNPTNKKNDDDDRFTHTTNKATNKAKNNVNINSSSDGRRSNNMNNSNNHNIECFADHFRPSSANECINPKRTKEIKEWISSAFQTFQQPHPQYRHESASFNGIPVLALTGNAGSGKSTTIEVLCAELGIRVIPWGDECLDSAYFKSSSEYAPGTHAQFHTADEYSNNIGDTFDSFITHAGYAPLNFECATSPQRQLRSDEQLVSRKRKCTPSTVVATSSSTVGGIITTNKKEGNAKYRRSIVLLHDIPPYNNNHNNNSNSGRGSGSGGKEKVNTLERFFLPLLSLRCPVVIVLSTSQITSYQAQYLFPTEIRNKIDLHILEFPPVTPTRLLRTLNKIKNELKLKVTDAALQELSIQCHGDLRQAIMQLQFLAIPSYRKPPQQYQQHQRYQSKVLGNNANNSNNSSSTYRDGSYSSLHAVGKLLAARCDEHGYSTTSNLDHVITSCDLSTEQMEAYLNYNSPEYFNHYAGIGGNSTSTSALEILVKLSDCCSDTDILIHRLYDSSFPIDHSFDTSFPLEYVNAMLCRCAMVATKPQASALLSNSCNQQHTIQASTKNKGKSSSHRGGTGTGTSGFVPIRGPVFHAKRNITLRRRDILRQLRNHQLTFLADSNSDLCLSMMGSINEIAMTYIPYLFKLQTACQHIQPSITAVHQQKNEGGGVYFMSSFLLSLLQRFQQQGASTTTEHFLSTITAHNNIAVANVNNSTNNTISGHTLTIGALGALGGEEGDDEIIED